MSPSFIMMGTSTAITDLVSKPFPCDKECFSHSPSSGTGRCCSSESLSKERGGNPLKSLLPDNHRLEVIYLRDFKRHQGSTSTPCGSRSKTLSNLHPIPEHPHGKMDFPDLIFPKFPQQVQDRRTGKIQTALPWAGFTVQTSNPCSSGCSCGALTPPKTSFSSHPDISEDENALFQEDEPYCATARAGVELWTSQTNPWTCCCTSCHPELNLPST